VRVNVNAVCGFSIAYHTQSYHTPGNVASAVICTSAPSNEWPRAHLPRTMPRMSPRSKLASLHALRTICG
jgi:hypothetical protein